MKNWILTGLCAAGLILSIGCSSTKEKAEEKVAVGDVESDSSVETKDMQFDAQGSDSSNIAGLSTVFFAYDKSDLTSKTRKALADNANWILENKTVTMQIEGHCDSRGSVEYNLALGERRAKAVKQYLISLGVPSNRLTIISYGKEKLLAFGDSEADHSRNRRANFVPLPN